jgi:hypothetical protein
MLKVSSTYFDQTHTRENLFEIWKNSILQEAQEPKPQPMNRTITVSDLTEGLGHNEVASRCLRALIGECS